MGSYTTEEELLVTYLSLGKVENLELPKPTSLHFP